MRRSLPLAIGLLILVIVAECAILAISEGSLLTAVPTPLSPAEFNMTRYAPPPCPDSTGYCSSGTGETVVSPDGRYRYVTNRSHYGVGSFVVLTAEYANIVYECSRPFPLMDHGGCFVTGWQPDGSLLFNCGSSDPDWISSLDPNTGQVSGRCETIEDK